MPNAHDPSHDQGLPDPITAVDIQPAIKGVDRVNNVEKIDVGDSLVPGVWTIRVRAFDLPNDAAQSFSLSANRSFSADCS